MPSWTRTVEPKAQFLVAKESHLLFGFDLALAFLFVFLVDKFFLEGGTFVSLFLKPGLFLHYQLLLPLLNVLLSLDFLLVGKFFP